RQHAEELAGALDRRQALLDQPIRGAARAIEQRRDAVAIAHDALTMGREVGAHRRGQTTTDGREALAAALALHVDTATRAVGEIVQALALAAQPIAQELRR